MKILLTGGTGRLGRALKNLLPGIIAPTRAELDITVPEDWRRALGRHQPQVVVHAAAFTDVAAAEEAKQGECWECNVTAAEHLALSLKDHPAMVIYISTDYVFDGKRGSYREDEQPGPAPNYYGTTKLAAERVIRKAPRHLVIRTSFREAPWPYAVAFTDLFTSQDYIHLIAPQIALAVENWPRIPFDTLHIAGERTSFFDLARRSVPEVKPGLKKAAPVALPDDVSLDVSRWRVLCAGWRATSPEDSEPSGNS